MAVAQERGSSGNFLDNLFNRGEQQGQQRQVPPQQPPTGRVAQSDPGDLTVRLDRMENVLRQLTGTIENLQYRNQQLEMQLKRMQDDTEYRFQQLGAKGSAPPPARQSWPPLRRLRSIATSECAGRAARPRQSGRDRCARARARQRTGWRSGRSRGRRSARSRDHGRK